MKTLSKFYGLLLLVVASLLSQSASALKKTGLAIDSVKIIQDSLNGRDCWIDSYNDSICYANRPEIQLGQWIKSGNKSTYRSFIWFDLTKIPAGATLISSKLSLSGYKSPTQGQTSDSGGLNTFKIFRVTTNAGFRTTSWKKQLSYDSSEYLAINKAHPMAFDVKDSNVLSMTKKMISTANFGFWMKADSEKVGSKVVFGSCYNPVKDLRPMLRVTYLLLVSKIKGTITKSNGKPMSGATVTIKNFDASHSDSQQIITDFGGNYSYTALYDSLNIKVTPNKSLDPTEAITYFNNPPSTSKGLVFYNNQDSNINFSTISLKNTFNINGRITTSNKKSLKNTYVYIYDINTTDSIAFKTDSVLTDTLGNYVFSNRDKSRFYLGVEPDSNIYPGEFQTFYPNKFYLQLGDSLNLSHDVNWDFSTFKADSADSKSRGDAYGTLLQCEKCFTNYLANRKLIITTIDYKPKAIIETNNKGFFRYDGLALLKRYRIFMDEPMVSTDSGKNSFQPLIYGITPGAIRAKKIGDVFSLGFDAGIEDFKNSSESNNLSYNPQLLLIELKNPNNVEIDGVFIYDVFGRRIISSTYFTSIGLDVSSLIGGMYIVKTHSKSGQIGLLKFVR